MDQYICTFLHIQRGFSTQQTTCHNFMEEIVKPTISWQVSNFPFANALVINTKVNQLQQLSIQNILYSMKPHINVFRPIMKSWILIKLNRTLTINK